MANSLLYQNRIPINNKISIVIPKLEEILADEDHYYHLISALTSMPIDCMVQLDDAGIDFTKINEYELFLLLFRGLQTEDFSLIFGDLDLTKFKLCENRQNDTLVLRDEQGDITIDRAIHGRIADTLRRLHHIEKNTKKAGNEEARKYLIERERIKQKRHKRDVATSSQLESLIVAMVNTEQFKYNYETVKSLSIYQFNQSVHQIIHKVDYDNRMRGVYAGTVSVKDLSQDDLNWIIHK